MNATPIYAIAIRPSSEEIRNLGAIGNCTTQKAVLKDIVEYRKKFYKIIVVGSEANYGEYPIDIQQELEKVSALEKVIDNTSNSSIYVTGVAIYVHGICEGFIPDTSPESVQKIWRIAKKYRSPENI